VANTTGGGDAVVFTPNSVLDLNTKYRFAVTGGVKDTAGNTFTSFSSSFTTSPNKPPPPPSDIRFDKIPLPNATGKQFTSVAVGPDHRLYVADQTGYIVRDDILDDGTLGASKTISTVRTANGGARLITGLLFAGSKKHPTVYVSHGYSSVLASPDWTGKISKLTGSNLENYQDLVTNLPRSYKDHLTNQMAWGPDGAIYISQASMTAMGAPDNAWGLRKEHLLSATVLRLDLSKLSSTPLNAKTADGGGSYNPFASGAPLTIYADGVRNSYDLVWTRDGHLYAATNGSASGGNTPAGNPPYTGHRLDGTTYTGPSVPGETGVASQPDYLYDIVQGGYYGHPNPLRDEYVMNGGNPTAGTDKGEVAEYPVGTQPDKNYRGFAWSFGQHESPDGALEYTGNAFGGKLDGKILVAQYSGGDNIVALSRSGGQITGDVQNIVGFTGFIDPLDMAEDTSNGNIYVAEYGGKRITLLRPDESTLKSVATLSTDQKTMFFNDLKGGANSPSQVLIIKNIGDDPLQVNAISLNDADAGLFTITQKPPLPVKLAGGASMSIQVAFKPSSSTSTGIHTATLKISSTDPNKPALNVALRGYAMSQLEGDGEPSLQRLMDLYQIPIKVGDNTPDEAKLPLPPTKPNDEVVAQTLVRADASKMVTIEPLASFSPDSSPLAGVGYYSAVDGTKQVLFDVQQSSYQQVHVKITGTQKFSPGKNAFGLYVYSPHYNHTTYSQDKKNKWDLTGPAAGRVMRFYPLKNADGTTVANAYVVTVEMLAQYSDQQDLVFIIRNVKPSSQASSPGTVTPPAPPTGLVVTDTAGGITLDWNASASGDVDGYIIKRSTNSKTNFIQLNTDLVTDTAYRDTTGGLKKYYYRVFAEDTDGNLSDPAKTSATVTRAVSNPAPSVALSSVDIGNPTPSGSTNALVSGDAYDMLAGGTDIQGASDQFRFAYQQLKGNFDVKVRVDSLTATDVWAKAGIMVRKTLDADARNIFMLASPSKFRLTYRVDPSGPTSAIGEGTPVYPNAWLRLARVGNVYTGYSSTDGVNWTPVASVTMNLGDSLFVGLAATSHNPAELTTAQFRDFEVA
jgi:glucose/arabinose dehydrogenase